MSDLHTLTDDSAPEVWPVCSECKVAFVFKRVIPFNGPPRWLWSADCPPRGRVSRPGHVSNPQLMTADGPYEPPT